MKNKLRIFVTLAIMLAVTGANAQYTGGNGRGDIAANKAATKLGNNFVTSGNWSGTGNWSSGVLPATTETVHISANATVDAAEVTVQSISIYSGGVLTIPSGKALTVNGTLANNSGNTGLVIKSTADGTGSLIFNNSGAGATIERYMTGLVSLSPLVENWHAISSPVAAQDIHGFLTTQGIDQWDNSGVTRYGFAPYVESGNHWDYYTGTTVGILNPGQGYEALISTPTGTVNFTGALNYAAINPAVTRSNDGATYGWNLIGNPYSCSLDVAGFLDGNSGKFQSEYLSLFVWNSVDKKYDITLSGTIPPGQGFFVKVVTGTTTVAITTGMKTHIQSAFKSGQSSGAGIKLSAAVSGKISSTEIRYMPGMSRGIDEGNDIGVFNGQKSEFELFTRLIEGSIVDIGLQSLPDNDYENLVVPVGLIAKSGSQVTFKAEVSDFPANYRVYLEDRDQKRYIRLDQAGSYYSIILTSASTGPGRFYLHTKQGTTGIDTEINDGLTIIPMAEQQIIRILGPVDLPARATVYDLNGRMINMVSLTGSLENEIPLKRCINGIYLLKIQSEGTMINRKISWNR